MQVMRLLICGGRNFADRKLLYEKMDDIKGNNWIGSVITGGARGADKLGDEWAKSRKIDREIFFADWNKYGKGAGPIRNQRMLDEGRPTLVVAFPGGKGTADMVRRAKTANIPVIEINS